MRCRSFGILAALASVLIVAVSSAASAAGIGGQCAGIAGGSCNAGLYCELEAGACGRADAPGQCRGAPHFCGFAYAAVCGCDGHTYRSDCERMRARVQKAHGGPCGGGPFRPHHRREKDATEGQQ